MGTDIAGRITLNTGTSLVAGETVLTMTYAGGPYPNGSMVTFSAGNQSFAGVLTMLYCTSTTTTAVLTMVGIALTLNTSYVGFYKVVGY